MNQPSKDLIVPGTDPDIVALYATLAERAATDLYGFEDEVCILDVETTGFDPKHDRLIEVAAAIMRGPEIIDRFSTLVDPDLPIPYDITRLTGIDDAMVAGAPPAEKVVSDLLRFIGDRDVIAHNASFDRSFIERVAGPGSLRRSWLDSLVFARIGLPRLRSHRLSDLAAAFTPEVDGGVHRAPDDVTALCGVWRVALAGVAALDHDVLERITSLAPGAEWPERTWLTRIAAGRTHASYDLAEVRRRRVNADKGEALDDADDVICATPDCDEVLAEFSATGIAGRMYEGFEARDEQRRMAVAVLEAFSSEAQVAIEAGTGVGKSIAYLIPAAQFSVMNNVSVGVATKTNALMDQLVYHELPRLAATLGEELRYTALKGYDHYPCLRKLDKAVFDLDANAEPELIGLAATLLAWISQSAWGDLDAINVHWRRDVRQSIQATQSDCAKKRCRYYPNLCYLHGVRRRASSANIVVTNHALLFRDVIAQGGILPPIRHWIVDEAHSAEAEARKQLTEGVVYSELATLLQLLHGRRGGLLDGVRRKLQGVVEAMPILDLIARMEEETKRCSTLTVSLFGFVKDLAPMAGSGDYDSAELWVDANVRGSGPWGVVASTGASLARRLETVLTDGRDLVTRLEAITSVDLTEAKADLTGLLSRLAEQHYGLVAVIDGEDDDLVYSARLDRRPNVDAEQLIASRLDVGSALVEGLYPRTKSIVFTSATMAMGDSFEHFAHGVGLDRLPEGSWSSLRLSSSYDFERQMAVYVPTDIPEPRSGAYLTGLESLLEGVHTAMGGSVLTLFTNRREMERLYTLLEPKLRARGLGLIMQARGTSAKRLRDEFIADETLSLFALKSFWEGFDAKGDTLRCVVIPRLPFGRPTDPLARERSLREGSSAWRRYDLPDAVLEVKQAAGRLIRSSTDTGCLVLADARVVQMGYGRAFLDSLPVTDIERVPTAEMIKRMAERFGAAREEG